jgi:tetratricopeptide (TPR) repeat protein
MRLALIFLFPGVVSFAQNPGNMVAKYNDSANFVTNKLKDFEKGIYYIDKAIELDTNYSPSYEKKLRFLMVSKRYDEANQVVHKLLKLSNNSSAYLFMEGLLFENKGDSSAALKRYQQAERNYKSMLDSLKITDFKYEYIVINRAMNLLFMREDSLAKQICVDYYENHKKNQESNWLNRILSLDRNYYYCLFFGEKNK